MSATWYMGPAIHMKISIEIKEINNDTSQEVILVRGSVPQPRRLSTEPVNTTACHYSGPSLIKVSNIWLLTVSEKISMHL